MIKKIFNYKTSINKMHKIINKKSTSNSYNKASFYKIVSRQKKLFKILHRNEKYKLIKTLSETFMNTIKQKLNYTGHII